MGFSYWAELHNKQFTTHASIKVSWFLFLFIFHKWKENTEWKMSCSAYVTVSKFVFLLVLYKTKCSSPLVSFSYLRKLQICIPHSLVTFSTHGMNQPHSIDWFAYPTAPPVEWRHTHVSNLSPHFTNFGKDKSNKMRKKAQILLY